MSKGRSLLLTV